MKQLDTQKHTYILKRITGKGRGNEMGIATINFEIPDNLDLPYGVYAAWVIHQERKYPSAVHFGPRPTFKETDVSLEAYILDGQIYTENAPFQMEFVTTIRGIETFSFPTQEALLDQITQDIDEVKKALV